MKRITIATVLGAMALATAPAEANAGSTHYFSLGEATTGFNRQLGVPIWYYPAHQYLIDDFGAPPQVLIAGFKTTGRYDASLGEGNGNSFSWDPSAQSTDLVATHYDVDFMPLIGTLPSHVPDEVLNVHLDNVRMVGSSNGFTFVTPPCANDSTSPTNITRAFPCDDSGMELGDYLSAGGFSHFKCRDDGTARIRIWGWNMRPNRMYSTWFVKEDLLDVGELINGVPFGGVPNVVITNKWGTAYLDREIAYCPDQQEDALGYVFALRSNGQNSGGVPIPFTNQGSAEPFSGFEGFYPGGAIHVHVSWNVNGVPFDPDNPPF